MKTSKAILFFSLLSILQACAHTQSRDIFHETDVDEPEGPGLLSGDSGRIIIIENQSKSVKPEK